MGGLLKSRRPWFTWFNHPPGKSIYFPKRTPTVKPRISTPLVDFDRVVSPLVVRFRPLLEGTLPMPPIFGSWVCHVDPFGSGLRHELRGLHQEAPPRLAPHIACRPKTGKPSGQSLKAERMSNLGLADSVPASKDLFWLSAGGGSGGKLRFRKMPRNPVGQRDQRRAQASQRLRQPIQLQPRGTHPDTSHGLRQRRKFFPMATWGEVGRIQDKQ